jgi:hypothetical protein
VQPAAGFVSIEHRKWACATDELKANEAREEREVLPGAGPEVIVRVLAAPCAPRVRGVWHAAARRDAARRPRRQWLARTAAEVACARSGAGTTGGRADAEARPVSRTRAAEIRTPHSAPRRAGEIVRRAERADRRVMRFLLLDGGRYPQHRHPQRPRRRRSTNVLRPGPVCERAQSVLDGPAVAPGPASPRPRRLAVDRPALARIYEGATRAGSS